MEGLSDPFVVFYSRLEAPPSPSSSSSSTTTTSATTTTTSSAGTNNNNRIRRTRTVVDTINPVWEQDVVFVYDKAAVERYYIYNHSP